MTSGPRTTMRRMGKARQRRFLVTPFLALLATLVATACAPTVVPAAPFAVVELFTSEGCSSCPPADRLLGRLAEEVSRSGRNVYPLAFHVDYWDYLGWSDRFARAEFGSRQQWYASALHADGVYTPQLVVNGTVSLVGSDERRIRAAIAEALTRSPAASVSVSVTLEDRTHVATVQVLSAGLPPGATINIAVVEDALSTRVLRGENASAVLNHSRVVRAFRSLAQGSPTGPLAINVPADLVASRSSVVIFAQDNETGRVLAAADSPLR